MLEDIKRISKEIKKELLPHLKAFKDFKVIPIYKDSAYLGYYKGGSYEKPIIKLNIPQLYDACYEYNVDFTTAIYTTILHEIGHAIQEYHHISFNEDIAEQFAYDYYEMGVIRTIK